MLLRTFSFAKVILASSKPFRFPLFYVCDLAARLAIPIKHGKQREGIEIFPKQDFLKPGRYGNAIRGPLGIHWGAGQRFWFAGVEEGIEAHMRHLGSIPKVTSQQLARLIAGKSLPLQLLRPEKAWCPGESQFRILDHIHTPFHVVGYNNLTRCPSCAEDGHDRCGDNLSISIEDPRKYVCWAGCTSQMIRSSLGHPRY